MGQGLECYNFPNKRNWRRWKWNRIVERLKELNQPIKNAIVLYLPGPEDIDREIALAKGFKNNNLIAVDLNKDNITKIKENNHNAITANLTDIISHWGKEPKIDVIDADFCCGITKDVKEFMHKILLSPGLSRICILSINLMRGRDPLGYRMRKEVEIRTGKKIKHRGEIISGYFNVIQAIDWLVLENDEFISMINNGKITFEQALFENLKLKDFDNKFLDLYWEIVRLCKPINLSYRSGVTMDSCIQFFRPLTGEFFLLEPDKKLQRQIAALKAWRTIRQRG